jgi:hypothetical protein
MKIKNFNKCTIVYKKEGTKYFVYNIIKGEIN